MILRGIQKRGEDPRVDQLFDEAARAIERWQRPAPKPVAKLGGSYQPPTRLGVTDE